MDMEVVLVRHDRNFVATTPGPNTRSFLVSASFLAVRQN